MKIYYLLIISILISIMSCDIVEFTKTNQTTQIKPTEEIYDGVKKNYEKGKLVSSVTYKDSLKNGPAFNYYSNGNINMKFYYKNNLKNGPFKWYYENGKIYLEGEYKNDRKNGVFRLYSRNGNLQSEMKWIEDNPCVGLKEYTENGNIIETPKIIVNHINTIKLNQKYKIQLTTSKNTKNIKYYEGYLKDEGVFPDYFSELNSENGTCTITYDIPPGTYLMKTITIIAKIKAKDKNYYILKKDIDIAVENRN